MVNKKVEIGINKPSIGVLTYFRTLGPGLSYHKTTLDWQREILRQGYDCTLYVKEGCNASKEMVEELNMSAEIPNVKKGGYGYKEEKADWHEKSVKKLLPIFERVIRKHDIVITHDYTLLKDYVVLQDALRLALHNVVDVEGKEPPIVLNIYHSNLSFKERPSEVDNFDKYPERLRWAQFPHSRPVSLSHSSVQEIANGLMIPHNEVGVLPNPFIAPSPELLEELGSKWLEKDVLQIMPFCATRWDHKGIKTILKLFGSFKKNGVSSFLMLVTANGRGGNGRKNCQKMVEFADKCDLEYGEDYLITSLDSKKWVSGVPSELVNELQSYADLFVFASRCEMCPNVLGEASRNGQLVVIPDNLSVAHEISSKNVLSFNFPVKGAESYPEGENKFYMCVAREIYAVWQTNHVVQQKSYVRTNYSIPIVFKKHFEPLFYKPTPHHYPDIQKRSWQKLREQNEFTTAVD